MKNNNTDAALSNGNIFGIERAHLKKESKKNNKDKNGRDEGRRNVDDDPLILEPAIYHDIPTNKTRIADSNDASNPKGTAADTTSPSSAVSSTTFSFFLSNFKLFILAFHQFVIHCYNTLTFTSNQNNNQNNNKSNQHPSLPSRLGITIVCISDTHGQHRKLTMPAHADILIHAGDYTKYGKKEDVIDFNQWLGSLPYKTKIVVNGNHECNAMWKSSAKTLLSNAHLLINEGIKVEVEVNDEADTDTDTDAGVNERHDICNKHENRNTQGSNSKEEIQARKKEKKNAILNIHGTNFYWPCLDEHNPYYDQIGKSSSSSLSEIDILISHCPVLGYVDRDRGCPALLHTIKRIKPRIFICGHEHMARGIVSVKKNSLGCDHQDLTFVNAANAKGGIRNGHAVGKESIVLTL